MTKIELLRRAKRRLSALTGDRLVAADHYLAYLDEAESIAATEELLAIPGFLEAFDEAGKDVAAGRLTPVEDLKRKC